MVRRLLTVVALLVGLTALAAAGTGCRGAALRAGAIPQNLLARPVVDPATIDVARLSGTGVESQGIARGDLLSVRASTGIESEEVPVWHVRVDDAGRAPIPLIGAVAVEGLTTVGAEEAVRQASIDRGIYRNPSISVDIEHRNTHRVFVGGAVTTPGKYELPASHCDLRSALLAAGGLADSADPVVEIHRPGPDGVTLALERLDLLTATRQGAGGGLLPDGSVITVNRLPGRTVHVLGLVNKPSSLEIPPGQDMRMLDAIAAAGGTKMSLADKVYLVRKSQDRANSILVECSINEAKQSAEANPLLVHGDTLTVEETPTTFMINLLQQVVNVGLGFNPRFGF